MADPKPEEPSANSGILAIESIGAIGGITPVAPIPTQATSVPATRSARGKISGVEVAVYFVDTYTYPPCTREAQIDYASRAAQGFAGAMASLGHRWVFQRDSKDASPSQWNASGDKSQYGIDTVEYVLQSQVSPRVWVPLRPRTAKGIDPSDIQQRIFGTGYVHHPLGHVTIERPLMATHWLHIVRP